MTTLDNAQAVVEHMTGLGNAVQARHLMRFFKTGPGDYGYGDKFLGLTVPETRAVVLKCKRLELNEIAKLLHSPWHEVRLCGLIVLVEQFAMWSRTKLIDNAQAVSKRDEIVDFYLTHTTGINNWDLVDLSVYKILGKWLLLPSKYSNERKLEIIDGLAASANMWEQRMSVVCTMEPLKHGDPSYTLRYAQWHLHHPHDLMHKAVWWLLREMGKRVSMDLLRQFLEKHYREMPRTALRYAIEKMPIEERKQWMAK